MSKVVQLSEFFHCWIDVVTDVVVKLRERCIRQRVLKITEGAAGDLEVITPEGSSADPSTKAPYAETDHAPQLGLATSMAGSRVELTLQPHRILFQPLELPSRAADFLQGIVRAQIDRITPWNTADVAFGWSPPVALERERIVITIAATAVSYIKPYVQTITAAGARSVGVFARPPDDRSGPPIKIWEQNARDEAQTQQIRRILLTVLATAAIFAGVAVGASAIAGAHLDEQQGKLSHQISSIRARIGALRPAAGNSNSIAHAALERRKREAPSAVLILDTLSRVLPDTTYVTELRLEGDKVRLVGHTTDAPSLIGLLEQSGRFSQASFFAPTTRTASEPTERFHIEAIVRPLGASQS